MPGAGFAPFRRKRRQRGALGAVVPAAPAAPDTPSTPSPTDAGTAYYTLLSWVSARATKFDIYLGTVNPPTTIVVPKYNTTSYVPTINPSTTYYWKIVAFNDGGSATGPVWSFTTPAATDVIFALSGTVLTSRPRFGSLTISDVLGPEPNTGSLTFDDSRPTGGESIQIGLGSLDDADLLFGGEVQSIDQTYVGTAERNSIYPAALIDHTFRINRRRPFGTWTDTSATTIAKYLVATFASGFTSTHVQENLPAVSINFDGSLDFMSCMKALANAISDTTTVGKTKVDYARDVHLFLTETTESPDALTIAHPPLNNPAPIRFSVDHSQIRTRVYGKGHGETVPTDVLAGDTILPVSDAVMFSTTGGKAAAGTISEGAQTQILTYTGVQLGGAGSLVGPGVTPSVAPVAVHAAGSALTSGVYQYAYTDVTASGESLPSPLGTLTPVAAPTTIGIASELTASTFGGLAAGGTYRWKYTFRKDADGAETMPSPSSNSITLTTGHTGLVSLDGCQDPPSGWSRYWYRTTNGGSTWSHVPYGIASPYSSIEQAAPADPANRFVDERPDADLTTAAPSTTGSISGAITGIAAGPSGTTSRKLYRSVVNGSQLKLVATIANNTTTTYADSIADASLGANVVTSDTSGLTQVTGQVNAGSTSLLTAGTGPFPSSGWGMLSGNQIFRYTKIGAPTDVTFDAASSLDFGATLSWSHTCATSAVLFVFVRDDASLVTGVTYNASAMTSITTVTISGNVYRVFYHATPASGAHTITIAGPANTSAAAASYTNVDTTSVVDASTTKTTTGAITTTITSTTDHCWALYAVADRSGVNPTAGTNATSRATPGAGASMTLFDSAGSIDPAGAFSMTANASGACGAIMVTFKPRIDPNRLGGIPVSGAGAITTTVLYGSQVLPAPALTGINASNGIPRATARGAAVHLWVQRDDLSAQAALGQSELDEDGITTDGIREYLISNGNVGEELLTAMCDADLAIFSRPIVSVTYYTRDTKSKTGRTVSIALALGMFDPAVFDASVFDVLATWGESGDFTIQSVDIQCDVPGQNPLYCVSASSVAFTLSDLLRRVALGG